MANNKYVITVEDRPDGKVTIKCEPSFEAIMKMDLSGSQKMTAATGYAVALLNRAREISKSMDPKQIIKIARLLPGRMS